MTDLARDMKNEVVKSGVQGLADVNPQAAIGVINSGKFSSYMSGTEGDQLTKYAEGVTRMKMEDQTRAYEQQQRAQKMQEDATANKILGTVYNPQTGQLSIPDNINQQIFSNPALSAKSKIDLMASIKHLSQDSSVDDPAVMRDNAARLSSASTNPLSQDDLLQQMSQGKLTPQSYNFFNERLKQTPDAVAEKNAVSNALQQVQKSILTTPAPGIPVSPEQRQKDTAFTAWFMPAYTTASQDPQFKGMSQSQKAAILLSSTDPRGLLTPDKLAPYLQTPQQMLNDGLKSVGPLPSQGSAAAPAAQPAKPAQTDIDYLRKNPAAAAQYDKQFGAGLAAKILGDK